jgi:hypothetical protein
MLGNAGVAAKKPVSSLMSNLSPGLAACNLEQMA